MHKKNLLSSLLREKPKYAAKLKQTSDCKSIKLQTKQNKSQSFQATVFIKKTYIFPVAHQQLKV